LDEFDQALQNGKEGITEVALELLLKCVLSNPEEDDRDYLGIINWERGAELFQEHVDLATESQTPLFDENTAQIRPEEFTEDGWHVLENAAIHAATLGYDHILPPHCFLALLGETEGVAEQLLRLQLPPEVGLIKVSELVSQIFRIGDRKKDPVPLTREGIGEATVELLNAAQKTARLWGAEQIDNTHIFLVLLEKIPSRLAQILQRNPLALNLEKLQNHLEQHLREERTEVKKEIAFRLPEGLLPSEDLTWLARSGGLPKAVKIDDYFDPITRALYRRSNNHVLVTGMRGVGKTTVVRELARRAATGEIDFLKQKRFLWIDCQNVTPAESKNKLEGIFAHVSGRSDLVLVLDGLGPLLRAESGGDNKPALRAALKEAQIQLIGVLSNWDYEELLSADEQFLESFNRVTIEEPEEDAAIEMVELAKVEMENEYRVIFGQNIVERTVRLSANFIMNERLPIKAIKILRRVCEDIDYRRTQLGETAETVTREDIEKVVSEISGVPQGTVSGTGEKIDFPEVLSKSIIGQEAAVNAVAEELRLIKAGLSDPGKPASVMLFAGLTGVGKSELAKTIAKIYSASKSLQTYTMGNFSEPHSISGIIGVPPGYVGHDQGGRLINDINSDPYCVFLLDEAEKAHPEVWKPFLNLFDEGWIVDQRGVKAFADRSIFILTSNAGQDIIARMIGEKKPMEKIIEKVKGKLSEFKHPSTQQPIFTPEFLARIKKIIIFKPLDEAAMEGICRILVKQMQKTWKEKREKTVIIPDNLIKHIAKQSHQENEKSGGKEGGRIVRKKISELIEVAIQQEASKREAEYKNCTKIELHFISEIENSIPGMSAKPTVSITFSVEEPPTPEESISQAMEKLEQYLKHLGGDGLSPIEVMSERLAELERAIQQWESKHTAASAEASYRKVLKRFHKTQKTLETISQDAEKESLAVLEKFLEKVTSETGEKIDE